MARVSEPKGVEQAHYFTQSHTVVLHSFYADQNAPAWKRAHILRSGTLVLAFHGVDKAHLHA